MNDDSNGKIEGYIIDALNEDISLNESWQSFNINKYMN